MNSPEISSLQVIGSKGPGGAENFYIRFIQALHAAGAPVQALNPPGSPVAQALEGEVTQLHLKMRSVYDFVSRWHIQRIARQQRPDIVQTWMGRATRLTHLHPKHDPLHVARLGGYYNLKGYRHAHAWIGNTRGIADYLVSNGLPAERVFHIGNFVDPALEKDATLIRSTRGELGIPDDALIISAVGRLHPNKAFDTLLHAFTRLPDQIGGRPLHLVIVGDGDLREKLQAQAGQNRRVHWAGWQTDTDPYYHMADVFVCPSRHEPLGNVILEAWAHHCPVISTRTDGGLELVEDGVNGLLTEVDAPADMADALRNLLAADASARLALADNGLQTLESKFSREAIINQYLAVYQQLLQHRQT
jgi:glycosyltransferase involved in cell wall biosynthesis